ncbi:hypothetical protein [Pedobacter nutrimenti]|jgi:hypothetical protein|uniref:Uncharacterized protein n=1 Tax=Pedobacter nutrimenti TaxID=1241337 RepID=A0A318UDE2_9SPHI|nr:hypothetical protein [Pedobacter nutrimenti]PYF74416.1 hypothetical protein B0O44_104587 [Pedobacter nutrimenti]
MNLLPFENIYYKTKLKAEEVICRLNEHVGPEKPLLSSILVTGSDKPYEGEIYGKQFQIRRIINYRNSFLPRISGVVKEEAGETQIFVKMRLHLFVMVFLSVFCVFLIGISVLIFCKEDGVIFPWTLVPIAMLLFAFTMTVGCFKVESKRSKKDLKEIFEAETEG